MSAFHPVIAVIVLLGTCSAFGQSNQRFNVRVYHDDTFPTGCPSGNPDCSLLSCDVLQSDYGRLSVLRFTPLEALHCTGDVNASGVVNVSDLLFVIAHYGTCADPQNCPGDVNDDGVVNNADLLEVVRQWGPCAGFAGFGGGGDAAAQALQDCISSCDEEFPEGGQKFADCVGACIESLCSQGLIECGE